MMDIETDRCDECGNTHPVCSECGSGTVTPVDYVDGAGRPMIGIREAVLDADDGDELTVVQVCWECGAETHRTLDITVEAA